MKGTDLLIKLGRSTLFMWKHYEKIKIKIKKKYLQPFEAPEDKIHDTFTCHVELEQVNVRTAVIRMTD